ncbi:FliH/SctL family protein [Petrocella sp. FN5]|uniref:FliH/SctL family protein n=1 Tax=Petrocella sp. FN5 TaxID=3032002 RepID=UPI0023DB2A1B|nr:FliH/SctL family protein [Petrocella sp. FN5]MDF1616830.1 FliH/SctL family protein [Petrocella sp. FN5]
MRSLSKIIKAPFVSMSEIRKEIQTIDPHNPKIIHPVNMEVGEHEYGVEDESQHSEYEGEAIDDEVIDGSHTIAVEETEVLIQEMLDEAQSMGEQIKEQAREEGFEAGYEEGILAAKSAIDQKMDQLDQEREAMLAQNKAYIRDLEPKVAEVISHLLHKMIGRYADDPDIILYLVRLAFEEINIYGSIVIKCSPEDFDHLVAHKDALSENLSEKVNLEILKEITLEKNQCFIETDMGNIDCSLQVRLDSLQKELKLIKESLGIMTSGH